MIQFDWVLSSLRESLQLLASPADEQIRWLRTQRVHHDELALDYDDEFLMVSQLEVGGYLTREQVLTLTAVDRQLDAMSGHENTPLWTDEALRGAPEWERVRELATAALGMLEGK